MSQALDTWKQFAESYQTMSPADQQQARAKLTPEQQQYLDQVLETLQPTTVAPAATGFETMSSDVVVSAAAAASAMAPRPGKGVQFVDFEAEQLTKPGYFTEGTYVELDQVLDRVNAWIEQTGAEVINVETVVLPNIYSEKEMGTQDVSIRTSGEYPSTWNQFFRVWYRA